MYKDQINLLADTKATLADTKNVLADTKNTLDMETLAFIADFKKHVSYTLGMIDDDIDPRHLYEALALTVKDRLVEGLNRTRLARQKKHRHSYYMSMEYLIGRTLNNAVLNLDLSTEVKNLLEGIGLQQENIETQEEDAALGNGGLGRLAACFLDSCATLELPVTGYGLRYQYGMFKQKIENGQQVEKPDHWLKHSHIWEIRRSSQIKRVKFGGYVEYQPKPDNTFKHIWHSNQDLFAIPYDVPIPGYRNDVVNTLRLWKSVASEDLNFEQFNSGDHHAAIAEKVSAEKITMILYPNDATESGRALRLYQQYFLVSASLQDVVQQWVDKQGNQFEDFAEYNCFQLNDTHPACAIPELMRLLLDEYEIPWDKAWEITTNTMAYTNHTLLPEALEKWSVRLFKHLLPRILEIIYEIDYRLRAELEQLYPEDTERHQRMSIIEHGGEGYIRMANLAIIGSHAVNGVAELHTQLLKNNLFRDFHTLTPGKFQNKTNGVTFRRWIMQANPALSGLITEAIGDEWISDYRELIKLKQFVNDASLQKQWEEVKKHNKRGLADYIKQQCGININLNSIFDVQVKRIHEYKRQLLNLLHAVYLFHQIKEGTSDFVPRTIIFSGKAAPGYYMAKLIITCINNVADVINHDKDCKGKLNIVFLPNYGVSMMEQICPGTDLSEQISTAGFEASGTGNMKFMLNGALTIGTQDGANIEIMNAVGEEYFFKFGLTVEQIRKMGNRYNPHAIIQGDENLSEVLELLRSGLFNRSNEHLFDPVMNSIYDYHDSWKTAADFTDYVATQERVSQAFLDRDWWTKASIANTASSGWFSSDRTIDEYNRDIWRLKVV